MPTPILMPALSPTMEEGTLAKWLVNEGDSISAGDVIAEIETDKATMEVEAVDEGTVGKILIQAGTEGVAVNQPIAVLLEEGEDKSALDTFDAGGAANGAAGGSGSTKQEVKAGQPSDQPSAGRPAPARPDRTPRGGGRRVLREARESAGPAPVSGGERIFASPLARRLAKEDGIDLTQIKGTGPHGRIVKRDVEAAAGQPQAQQAKAAPAGAPAAQAPAGGKTTIAGLGFPEGSYEVKPLDGMRKTIAKRLTQSFRDVPHFPLTVDLVLDPLLAIRKELNDRAPERVKISVNDLLIRASALALKKVPESNASYTDEGLVFHKHAHVAVAVAIDGGLITPVIFEAETKGLATISAEMKDLAARARDRKLKPEEYQGGTFSLSNLGMFGISNFASILNEPQGMIMSVGAGEQRPVVRDGTLTVATQMTVTVTCDHRVVDGAIGARFLQAFRTLVEDPTTMLL